jgi:acetyl esterase
MNESPLTPEQVAQIEGLRAMIDGDPRTDVDRASLLRRFPKLASVQVRDVPVTGPHGPVPARLYRPDATPVAGIVWVHGGGFIAGGLDQPESQWVSLELAARGVSVLALDYQKAGPEVRHPVLSDEVEAGWLAVAGDEDLLGVPLARTHLGGASAGANLSAGVAVHLKERGGPMPASLVLVYPLVHDVVPEAGPEAAAAAEALPEQFRFRPPMIRMLNLNYVGSTAAMQDPVAFPARAEVRGLPATYILNAEGDDLRASGEAFGRQLEEADVPVRTEYEPGTVHGYLDQPGLPEAVRSIESILTWIAREPARPLAGSRIDG